MVLFEISVILMCLAFLLILRKIDQHTIRKFILICVAVYLFEFFTTSMWLNLNLERWAYLYRDTSWVLTIGWATIIIVSMKIIDLYFNKESEFERFLFYLVPITFIGIVAEASFIYLGIRKYPMEIVQTLSGKTIFGLVPIEALYYIPVFMALVISFSRYWEINFRENTLITTKSKKSGNK